MNNILTAINIICVISNIWFVENHDEQVKIREEKLVFKECDKLYEEIRRVNNYSEKQIKKLLDFIIFLDNNNKKWEDKK